MPESPDPAPSSPAPSSPAPPRLAVVLGSLRRESLNRRLAELIVAEFVARVPGLRADWADVGSLPLYNADIDGPDARPEQVRALDAVVEGADLSLWVTPVYNAGVSGAIKNALDWGSRPAFEGPLAGTRALLAAATPGGHPPDQVLENLSLSLQLCLVTVEEPFLAVTGATSHLGDGTDRGQLATRVAAWVEPFAASLAEPPE